MIIDFDWGSQPGFQNVLNMIYKIIDIAHIAVPIGLIVMTSLDVSKKVINPEDKEGQQKIMIRAIAALIVFLVPTIINIVFDIAGIDKDNLKLKKGNSTHIAKPTSRITVTPINTPKPTIPLPATSTPSPKPTATPTPTEAPTSTPSPSSTPVPEVSSLSIVNCPSGKVFKEGDIVTLLTDIPSYYSGNVIWGISACGFEVISESNSKIVIKITDTERCMAMNVLATLESWTSNDEQDSCTINIHH